MENSGQEKEHKNKILEIRKITNSKNIMSLYIENPRELDDFFLMDRFHQT